MKIDCTSFEGEMIALLTGPEDGPDREDRTARLKKHASSCSHCAAFRDLLRWLDLPAAKRGLAEDPDEAYWESFGPRLRERIRKEEAASRSRRRRGSYVAAAAVLAGVAFFVLWTLRPGPIESFPDPDRLMVGSLPANLADQLAATDPGIAQQELEFLVDTVAEWAGAHPEFSGGLLFPSTRDLDAEGRQRLLEWLGARESQLPGGSV